MPLAELTTTPDERGDTNQPRGKMPFGPFKDFGDCTSHMEGKYSPEQAKKVCGAMQARMEQKSDEGYTLTELPSDAQSLFVQSFEEAVQKNDEDASWRVAWAAVRRRYEKTISGKWVPLKVFDNIEFKSLIKSDRIIYGDASVAMVDSDGEMITEDALKTAFNSYITRGHVLFYHRNIPIGEVLPSYTTPDGKILKSGVQDKSLKVVVRVYKDTKKADEVWDAIERGDLRAFSIGGEVIGEPVQVCQDATCEKSYRRIDRIDLHEISIVPNPANEASFFSVIKSKIEKQPPVPASDDDEDKEDGAQQPVEKQGDPDAICGAQWARTGNGGKPPKDWWDRCTEAVASKAKTSKEELVAKLAALDLLINDETNKALNCPKFTEKAIRIMKGDNMSEEKVEKKDDFQERVLKELETLRKELDTRKPTAADGPMSQSSETADDNKEGTEKAAVPSSSDDEKAKAKPKAKAAAASSSEDETAKAKVEYVTKDDFSKAFENLAKRLEALVTKPAAPAPEVKKEEKPAEPPAPKIEVSEKKSVAAPPVPSNYLDTIDWAAPLWKAGEFETSDDASRVKVQDLIAKARGGK